MVIEMNNSSFLEVITSMRRVIKTSSPSAILASKQDLDVRLIPLPLPCEYCGIISEPDGTGHCPSCGAPVQITSPQQHIPSGIVVFSGVERNERNPAFEFEMRHAHERAQRS